ncbi:zinc finger protein 64-like [Oppia nitens]|uniref:zinc finger protein 64-like n=1 Tax=Oppia nitens TaxID=1686743 RepID=UPI0023DA3E3E|nr:zinc finger protein 64-like [Oppia nitens]
MYMKSDTTDSQLILCQWYNCGLSFGSQTSYSQHIKTSHFRIIDNLTDPLLLDNEIVIDLPQTNDRIIYEKDSKTVKLKTEAKENEVFVCDWIGCGLEFGSDYDLKKHKYTTHDRKVIIPVKRTTVPRFQGFKLLTIHKTDDNSEDEEMRQESEANVRHDPSFDKLFKCELCDKSYTRKDSLDSHLAIHHDLSDKPIKTYYCDYCEYESRNSGHMKRHIQRKHTNDKPFKCDLDTCDPNIKCFATREDLKQHQLKCHSI